MNSLVITAFILGLGGSLHCLGMCGPLVLGMPFHAAPSGKWLSVMIYNISKALAYGILGAASGFIGHIISLFNWQQFLSIAAGIFIIAFAFLPQLFSRRKTSFLFNNEFANLFRRIQAKPSTIHFAALGFLNGFLPCGLVYTAVAAAAVTATPLQGFLFMFIFGLGTIPALASLALFKSNMGQRFRQSLRKASMIIAVMLGVILIARGLNLGIPYLSPKVSKDATINCHNPLHNHTKGDTINCH